MVTVKTYPNPSQSYGETVCVAGVRLDRVEPEWIRLYPVKFRTTDLDARFKKYEIIEIPGTYRGANDPRPGSFKPRQDGIVHGRVVDSSKNWRERRDLVGGLLRTCTSCLRRSLIRSSAVRPSYPMLTTLGARFSGDMRPSFLTRALRHNSMRVVPVGNVADCTSSYL